MENGELKYKDEYTSETIPEGNLLETVFINGKLVKDYTLDEIRQRLHNGQF
jgi:nicotinamide phosphoribosyltransferase